MKSFSFARLLTLGCVACLALPVGCGDDDDSTGNPSGGSAAGGEASAGSPSMGDGGAGGAAPLMIPGTSDTSKTITCGSAMCSSVKTIVPGGLFVDPCCADNACGVSTQFFSLLGASFKNVCQAADQAGSKDTACPSSADQMLPVNGTPYTVPGFEGCCRADTGTCGVIVNDVAVKGIPLPFASPKLGCIDSAPFFNGQAAAKCGDSGAGGSGGASLGGAATGGAATGGAGAGGAGAGGAPVAP